MIKLKQWYLWTGIAVIIIATFFVTRTLGIHVPFINSPEKSQSAGIVIPDINDATTLGKIPDHILSSRDIPFSVDQHVPTNKWWSSGILEAFPAPLYAWPLVGHITPDGVLISAPDKIVSEKAVMTTPKYPLRIFKAGTSLTEARTKNWGDWHVTFDVTEQNKEKLFDMTMTQGSPFVFLETFTPELSIQLPPGSQTKNIDCRNPCGTALLIEVPNITYLVAVGTEGKIIQKDTDVKIMLPKDSHLLTVAVIASDGNASDYLPYAMKPISETKATFSVAKDTITTKFQTDISTLYGVFPHQAPYAQNIPDRVIGTYDTLRGTVRIYEGSSFQTVLARPAILPALPVTSRLRSQPDFLAQIREDIGSQVKPVGDVYASAKLLLKNAQLAELAHMTNENSNATKLLRESLQDWCTAPSDEEYNFFAYDTQMGGLLAINPAFGSEKYNDHHFHAGYFIHAAAILAQLDPGFYENYGDCINLIIKDIATIDRENQSFPYLRTFDPYAGHSWANGIEYLLDGNNQESTSEAIHAWFSLILWGKVTQDKELENLGLWLMAQEITATRIYWFNITNTLPETFEPPMISILWGGKVDYGTFFDGSQAAIHGIQFFPVTTALLPTVQENILSQLVEPIIKHTYDTIWDTNLVLVNALNGKDRSVPAHAVIDSSLSKSYITHWIETLNELGSLEEVESSCAFVFAKNESLTAVMYRYPQDKDTCSLRLKNGREVHLQDLPEGWNILPL